MKMGGWHKHHDHLEFLENDYSLIADVKDTIPHGVRIQGRRNEI